VPEDQHVDLRVSGGAPLLAPGSRTGLVHDAEPHTGDVRLGDLREPLAEGAVVVVAADTDQTSSARLELVEEAHVDPVTGMEDHLRLVDAPPQLPREVLGPLGNMGVGDQQDPHRHDQGPEVGLGVGLDSLVAPVVGLWSGEEVGVGVGVEDGAEEGDVESDTEGVGFDELE
jgi:hypothetical protein